jgi:hypothetical protein
MSITPVPKVPQQPVNKAKGPKIAPQAVFKAKTWLTLKNIKKSLSDQIRKFKNIRNMQLIPYI